MKKLMLIAFSACICFYAYSQNTGIGEVTPTAKLEVKGNGTGTGSTFLLKNNSSSLIMKVQDNGLIGLGTGTPQYRLDILGRMRVQTGVLGNITTTSGMWLDDYRDGTTRIFAGMQDSIRWGLYGENTGLGWDFNFNARTGQVGMGRIADGSAKLNIDEPNGYNINFYGNNLYAGSIRSTDTTLQIYPSYGSSLCFPSPCPAKDLILAPPGSGFLTFPGNVGIGVNGPKAKLHISGGVLVGNSAAVPAAGYTVSIDGKIIAEEVRVQLSTAWPDYVFNKSYKLRSFSQLEKYINTNKHLPGIPSATEMEKGQDIGETQRKMMEKIEELYLYVLQLNKENEKLKKEVEQLKSAKRK